MSLPKNSDQDKTNLVNRDGSIGKRTVATVLTGVGRAAIAVVGLRGEKALAMIERCFHPATQRAFAPGQIRYGTWLGSQQDSVLSRVLPVEKHDESAGESVVVIPIADCQYEIHCHGGVAATERIIADLASLGAVSVVPDDPAWQSDALVIREAKNVLSQCLTTRMASVALDQVRGAMLNWCDNVLRQNFDATAVRAQSSEILEHADLGAHLSVPYRVVLAGPPNVGKSSLINAITGYDRSITMNSPGTTRDVLHAETVIDGIPIRFSDTAGIRDGMNPIEREGILRANEAIKSADLVVWVNQPDSRQDTDGHGGHLEHGGRQGAFLVGRSINVLNKADLLPKKGEISHSGLLTVAPTGQGLPQLMTAIRQSLVAEFPAPGSAVPLTERQCDHLQRIVDSKSALECHQWVTKLKG